MRVPFLFAVTLMLAACGNNDQTDTTQNVDENLTAQSIVSNDVTAIDAVTADAANMAADVDMNFGNLEEGGDDDDAAANAPAAKPSRPAPKPSPAPATNTATPENATANAE